MVGFEIEKGKREREKSFSIIDADSVTLGSQMHAETAACCVTVGQNAGGLGKRRLGDRHHPEFNGRTLSRPCWRLEVESGVCFAPEGRCAVKVKKTDMLPGRSRFRSDQRIYQWGQQGKDQQSWQKLKQLFAVHCLNSSRL